MPVSVVMQKVVKRFGEAQVIRGVDLEIQPGEFTVFVGPSGCGKSTLLRMMAGLEPVSAGNIFIDGERMNDVPASKRGIAMVFQSYALYPHMSVRQNLAFGLETARLPKAAIEPRVMHAAGILRIETLLKRKPRQLSGGQRQRVAIGRAIVREPGIFLFDEPLSNLDAELRVQMRVEIAKLHKRLGNTMVYVTHDQVEAMTMADKIVVLNSGAIEQVGTSLDLYNSPRNRFVAGFIGSPKMNFIPAQVNSTGGSQGSVAIGSRGLDLKRPLAEKLSGSTVELGIRPEHVKFVPQGVSLGPFHVELVEHLGGQTLAYGRLEGRIPMTIALDGQANLRTGSVTDAWVKPELVHLFGIDGLRL